MSPVIPSLIRAGTNRRILSATSGVMAATLAVKLLASAKEFAVAAVFARSDALEAFLAAALIPSLLVNLIAESMNQALVPTLLRVRASEGREPAQRLFSSALAFTCMMLTLASMTMAMAAPMFFPMLGWGFRPAKLSLAVHLFYGLLPVVVLAGSASLCASALNIAERFAQPAFALVTTPAAILVATPLLAGRFGIWAILIGTVTGALLQMIWVGWMMRSGDIRPAIRWHGMDEAARTVAWQFLLVFFSGLVGSGGLLVDQMMAAMLPAGSVATLAYAGRFVAVPMSLLSGAISTAVTPYFCSMVADHDWGECRRSILIWGGASAGVGILCALLLITGGKALISLMLQHGAFGAADTSAVSEVLAMYAIQIPFFACSRVFYRALIAMRRTDLVFYCGLLNLVLDIVLNLILMKYFGVAGIALATSLWTMSTLVFLGYWCWRLLPKERAVVPIREG